MQPIESAEHLDNYKTVLSLAESYEAGSAAYVCSKNRLNPFL
jgi:hypothetical protein